MSAFALMQHLALGAVPLNHQVVLGAQLVNLCT